ncbi:hypothetical protein ACFODT_02530 [Vibrio zhugei]|uniref:DUF1240 domain-containing protein n=1 Tax=Vibrio zhugei TaxID=2479546 RepID=A0ABV7C4Z8_9VIBR|nr:hypothetical protein [Vibrio zhugei]
MFILENISTIFESQPNYVVITGAVNIWAMFSFFFFGICAFVMTLVTTGSWRQSKYNKLYVRSGLISALLIAPLLAGALFYQLKTTATGFVECKELSRSARRFSSHTYAISPKVCEKLRHQTLGG